MTDNRAFKQLISKWKIILRFINVKLHLYNNRKFWKKYYKKHRDNEIPSLFAVFCLENYIKPGTRLLELGCGNGRDAFYFAKNNLQITALDLESEEIKYLTKKNKCTNLKFLNKDFTTFSSENTFDIVYSRFTIHSISSDDETLTFKNTYKNLKKDGLFLMEVRSIKDEMFITSDKLSDNEGTTDHYRRFINYKEVKQKLEGMNFKIIFSIESTGLAPHKEEDPMIIRIIAKK